MNLLSVFCVLLDIAPGGVAGMVLLPFVLVAAVVIIAAAVLIKTLKKKNRAGSAAPAPARRENEPAEDDRAGR